MKAHRRGVEEGEGVGVGAAGPVQLRREAGVHGRVAADPHRQQPIFCLRPGPAAPWAMVRHCRAKIGDVADPATSPVSSPGRHHVILPPRHHTWRGFRRAMAIGAAKSVSFEEKKTVLDLKLVYKKC